MGCEVRRRRKCCSGPHADRGLDPTMRARHSRSGPSRVSSGGYSLQAARTSRICAQNQEDSDGSSQNQRLGREGVTGKLFQLRLPPRFTDAGRLVESCFGDRWLSMAKEGSDRQSIEFHALTINILETQQSVSRLDGNIGAPKTSSDLTRVHLDSGCHDVCEPY